MSYIPIGEEGSGITTRAELKNFKAVDDKSGDNLSGYTSLSSLQDKGPITSQSTTHKLQKHDRSKKNALKDAIRLGLTKAKDAAANMEVYAESGELMELSLAGFRLRELLDDLWDLRFEREDDWGDLLNMLQGVLAQEEFEKLSSQQCYVIHAIVADHLGAGAVDIDDIEHSVKLLRKAGFDPWKGISGTLDPDEHR